jgi:FkbM family methyltransferase
VTTLGRGGDAPHNVIAPPARERLEHAIESVWHIPIRRGTKHFRAPNRMAVLAQVLGLSILGLLVYNRWLTTTPLSAGDWTWQSPGRLQLWWPWPPVWDPTYGFGLKNFAQSYEFPIFAVAGFLTHLGLSWGLVEKLLYFWPFAVLSFVTPWALGRQLLGRSWWPLIAAVIFGSNTALLQVSTVGHSFLAMGEVLAPLVFASFIKSIRSRSLLWALVSGLLLALQSAYEFRIMYLTVLACLGYVIVIAVSEPSLKLIRDRAILAGASLLTLAGCESYWALPLFTYHGDYGLNLPATPWLAFMTLFHGLAGVDPFWTWGPPTWFQTVQSNPIFLLLPLLAFLPLVARRVTAEILWLTMVALGSAFLIKQTNPPFGEVYSWMFQHVPGWNMFREASKLYFLVAVAYSILVAFWLRHISTLRTRSLWRKRAGIVTAVVSGMALGVLMVASLIPVATGAIGSTTRPTDEPASFSAFRTILENDHSSGSVLWFGGPWAQARPGVPDLSVPNGLPLGHGFSPASARHPVVELFGMREPLTAFCQDKSEAYCYLSDPLFPYLVHRVGATYIVSPTGPQTESLLTGRTSKTVLNALTKMFGQPQQSGTADDGLAYWTMPEDGSSVIQAPATVVLAGSADQTYDALPALEALDLPVIYQADPSTASLGPGRAKSVEVIPEMYGGYQLKTSGVFYLMAQSPAAHLSLVGLPQAQLQTRLTPKRSPQWRIYGPVALRAGFQTLTANGNVTLGPLIRQSSLAESVLSGDQSSRGLPTTAASAEDIVASNSITGPAWFELRQTSDPGWQTGNGLPHFRGDSLFNLFFVPSSPGSQVFSFSPHPWERLGTWFALLWAVGVAAIAFTLLRRRRATPALVLAANTPKGAFANNAHVFALIGVPLVAAAVIAYTLVWFGLHSPGDGLLYLTVGGIALALSCVTFAIALGVEWTSATTRRRLGSPLLDAVIRFLVRHRLWGPTKATWDQIQRVTGKTTRRRRHAAWFYGQFIRDGDLCFDVGASVGNRTAVFLDLGAKVVAVEPQPSFVVDLRTQLGANGRLVVIPKAAGSHAGRGQLMDHPSTPLSSMSKDSLRIIQSSGRFQGFHADSWNESGEPDITTLDELIQEFGTPAFCNIDTEGFEAEVLRGLSRPIRVVSFEFTPEFSSQAVECLRILQGLGPCQFNYSLGESLRLELDTWVTAEELERTLRTLPDTRIFGDVYARFLDLGNFR